MRVRVPPFAHFGEIMKRKTNKEICDFCGHFWTPSMFQIDTCSICGSGSCIKIGSKLDFRRKNGLKIGEEANMGSRAGL